MRIRRILQIAAVVSTISILVVSAVLFNQRAIDARHSLDSRNLNDAVRKITLLLSLLQEPLGIQNERTASQWQAHYDELTPTLQALPELDSQARSLKLRIIQEHASIGALFNHLMATNQNDVAGDVREMIGGQLVVRTASMVSDVLAINDLTDGVIYRDRQRMMAVMAGAVAFLAGVVALLQLVLHRRVVAPVVALAGATEDLRAGRLDRPIPVSGSDEVGKLASSFEHMRVALRDRLKDLAEANAQLREAREEAEKRAAELDAAFTSLAEGVVFYNADHQITYLNPSAEKMLGFSVTEVRGLPASERVQLFTVRNVDGSIPAREELAGWRALHGETVRGEEFTVVSRGLEAPIHLFSSAAPIRLRDGKTIGAIQTLSDITDRKRAEEELRQAKQAADLEAARSKVIIESIVEGICVADAAGNFIEMNPAGLAIHEFESLGDVRRHLMEYPDLFEGRTEDGSLIPVEEWPMARALRGETFTGYELWVTRKDTGKKWIGRYSGAPARDKNGNIILAIITLEDITQRKLYEKELRRSRDELEDRVEERTKELAAANKELEAFSYSVSHDLRAPLQTISGFSRFLFDDYEDKLGEEGAHYLSRLRAATEHMSQLIDDILKLSKLSRTQLVPETVDLSGIAREVVDGLKERNPSRIVRVTIAPDLHIRGDRGLLRVMLENLLGNAWKFTENIPEAAIELQASWQDGESVYCIQDNGAGFDMKFASKLFIPFSRLHTQAEFSGTGIGLALVQRILNRHGGRIWAESEPGKGATFCFTLPS